MIEEKANPELIKFILECRRRGFDDSQIKEPLLNHGWPLASVDKAFESLKRKNKVDTGYKVKNQVTVYLTSDVLSVLEKRAKKNLFNLNEQIEDILRRSCINTKKLKQEEDKVDDLFLKLFSRKKR